MCLHNIRLRSESTSESVEYFSVIGKDAFDQSGQDKKRSTERRSNKMVDTLIRMSSVLSLVFSCDSSEEKQPILALRA